MEEDLELTSLPPSFFSLTSETQIYSTWSIQLSIQKSIQRSTWKYRPFSMKISIVQHEILTVQHKNLVHSTWNLHRSAEKSRSFNMKCRLFKMKIWTVQYKISTFQHEISTFNQNGVPYHTWGLIHQGLHCTFIDI